MDVRSATEVPDERGTLQTPDIPFLVASQILVLVEREVDALQAAIGLQGIHRFLHVSLTVRSQQLTHDFVDEAALVRRELTGGDAGELALLELDGVLGRTLPVVRTGA